MLAAWRERERADTWGASSTNGGGNGVNGGVNAGGAGGGNRKAVGGARLRPRLPGHAVLTWVLLRRRLYNVVQDPAQFLRMIGLKCGVGLLVGIIWLNEGRSDSFASIYPTIGALFLVVNNSSLDILLETVLQFPIARALLRREYNNGYFTVFSYWLSLLLSNLFICTLNALLLAVPVYLLVGLTFTVRRQRDETRKPRPPPQRVCLARSSTLPASGCLLLTTSLHTLSPLASHFLPLASRLSPLNSRLLATHLSPLASRLSPLASRLSPPHQWVRFGSFVACLALMSLIGGALGVLVGCSAKDIGAARSMILPTLVPLLIFSGYLIPLSRIPWCAACRRRTNPQVPPLTPSPHALTSRPPLTPFPLPPPFPSYPPIGLPSSPPHRYFKWCYYASFFQYSFGLLQVNELLNRTYTHDCPAQLVEQSLEEIIQKRFPHLPFPLPPIANITCTGETYLSEQRLYPVPYGGLRGYFAILGGYAVVAQLCAYLMLLWKVRRMAREHE